MAGDWAAALGQADELAPVCWPRAGIENEGRSKQPAVQTLCYRQLRGIKCDVSFVGFRPMVSSVRGEQKQKLISIQGYC